MSNIVSSICQRKKAGSAVKKAILMYMADKASDDGSGIWVSKSNMAADLEMGLRTVQDNIKAMLAAGLLTKAGQRQCSTGYTVDYTINLEVVGSLEDTRETAFSKAPLQQPHPYPCENRTPTPATAAPKPSIEPSSEPNNKSAEDERIDWYFEPMWKDYRKKAKKKEARRAFVAALKKISYYDLLPKYEAHCKKMETVDLQFVPHLSSWLNGERWNDE